MLKRSLAVWVAALTAVVATAGTASAQEPGTLEFLKAAESHFTTLIREAAPSVVAISRVRTESSIEFDPVRPNRPDPGSPNVIPNDFGTGVVVRENGLILTMYHVVRGGPTKPGALHDVQLVVRLNDRRALPAYIHAADPRSDLAILKIDAVGLKPLAIDFEGQVEPGRMVIALGNPYSIARDGSPSASWGILSNVGRSAELEGSLDREDEDARRTVHHLGTLMHLDMRVDLGGSGAPVLNLDGKLIGLTTSLAALAGYEKSVGFAVPINPTFRRIIEDLIAGQEVGYGFLGITNPLEVGPAQLAGLPQEAPHRRGGATFGGVMKNTPAENRLRKDDIILEIGQRPLGRPVTLWTPIFGPDDLMREVALIPPGTEIEMRLWRNSIKAIITVPVTLGKWPVIDEEGIVAPNRRFWRGMHVDYSTARKKFLERKFVGMEASPGLVVVEVEEGSPAHRAGIRAGDILLRVGRSPVATPRQFAEAVKDETESVTLVLERDRIELPPN